LSDECQRDAPTREMAAEQSAESAEQAAWQEVKEE
jgi:hypothetical protein